MDVHQVRCFVAVAEEEHFGRAAQRLRLSPSPVTRAVQELESEIGGKLFTRRYRHVALTPAGRQILPSARDLLNRFDDLKAAAQAAGTKKERATSTDVSCPAPTASKICSSTGGGCAIESEVSCPLGIDQP